MTNSPDRIIIKKPDDWHIHLRDGAALEHTCASLARSFGRAIIMPNLAPAITTVEQAAQYRERILAALPQGIDFEPLMTLYLTEATTPEEIARAADSPFIHACKLYPAGATTNSDSGVRDVANIYSVLESMQTHKLPLLVHGEVTRESVDIFDREKYFIDEVFQPIINDFPELKCVFEHITTKDAVDFVNASSMNIGATITIHHLLFDRNHMLAGGIKPHFYCLPVLKRSIHREALTEAALSGSSKFFLGSDSAPHSIESKQSACGCAGIYSAPAALELYTEFFDENNALDKLENFASVFGPQFYGLQISEKNIELVKESWQMPESLQLGSEEVIPIMAGQTISWTISPETASGNP